MKRFWLAAAVLAVLTGLSVWWVWESARFTDEVADLVTTAQAAAEEDDLEAAHAVIGQAAQQWESKRGVFGSMMRHQEADDITADFSEAEAQISCGQREEFLALCARLLSGLHHIADMEAPHFYNIL
jgi:hypothetical protein